MSIPIRRSVARALVARWDVARTPRPLVFRDSLDFANWLRAEMVRQNVGTRELERRSGINHGSISRLLAGLREPRYDTVASLYAALRRGAA